MPRVKQFDEETALIAAMNLFWKKGFNATSMNDLVGVLKVNRASMYDTFGNKTELFHKTLLKYQFDNAKKVADFLYYQTNVRQGLYLLYENHIDTLLQDQSLKGCFIANSIAELANSDERVANLAYENQKSLEKIYMNYLQYGVNQGQISPYKDIKVLASYFYTLENGLNLICKVQQDKNQILKVVSASLSVLD